MWGNGDLALHDDVLALRNKRLKAGQPPVPDVLQGVTKAKVAEVLGQVALGGNADIVDGVFALLDDETPSWFAKAPEGAKVADGATTAHLACHIGILQRGAGKLDREGRDYWIKPLRELGGFVPITLLDGAFIAGHVKAKSPNSCYRLDEELVAIFKAPAPDWRTMLTAWASADAARSRRTFQAEMEEVARKLVDNGHAELIQASIEHYAARFLPGYQLLYVDDSDGDRVSDEERRRMEAAGVSLTLEDAMPDALLWHPGTDHLWVIEAVTSDGEVDFHKVAQMERMAARCGKSGVGFTTTYRTWKDVAARQSAHGNIAVGTYIWIQSDPAKHLKVEG
jgi:BsuBI/PstI restriction endonuclease domain